MIGSFVRFWTSNKYIAGILGLRNIQFWCINYQTPEINGHWVLQSKQKSFRLLYYPVIHSLIVSFRPVFNARGVPFSSWFSFPFLGWSIAFAGVFSCCMATAVSNGPAHRWFIPWPKVLPGFKWFGSNITPYFSRQTYSQLPKNHWFFRNEFRRDPFPFCEVFGQLGHFAMEGVWMLPKNLCFASV